MNIMSVCMNDYSIAINQSTYFIILTFYISHDIRFSLRELEINTSVSLQLTAVILMVIVSIIQYFFFHSSPIQSQPHLIGI